MEVLYLMISWLVNDCGAVFAPVLSDDVWTLVTACAGVTPIPKASEIKMSDENTDLIKESFIELLLTDKQWLEPDFYFGRYYMQLAFI